jgi:hypothetical protein
MRNENEWQQLMKADELERQRSLVEHFTSLSTLSEEERRSSLKMMIEAVYSHPKEDVKSFTKSRLRSWARLDPETARVIADSYNATVDNMPGDIAWSRVAIVREAANELSKEEQESLRLLNPKILPDDPIAGYVGSVKAMNASTEEPAAKPWWMFWRS